MKTSRRSFLGAGLALPALLEPAPSLASHAPEAAASKDSSFDPWVEIHRENLHHNVQEISRRVGSRPILAVMGWLEEIADGRGRSVVEPYSIHRPARIHYLFRGIEDFSRQDEQLRQFARHQEQIPQEDRGGVTHQVERSQGIESQALSLWVAGQPPHQTQEGPFRPELRLRQEQHIARPG